MVLDSVFIMVLTSQSRGMVDDLRRGDKRSKDIANIIERGVSAILSGNGDRMMKDINPIYDKLSKINNDIFVNNGGVLGSGGFIQIEADERYKGIDGDGLERLMLHVAALTKLLETPRGPLPTPEESVVEIFKFVFWSALMALNDDGLAKDLIMVINKHAIRKS